jgi:hypothetical protein
LQQEALAESNQVLFLCWSCNKLWSKFYWIGLREKNCQSWKRRESALTPAQLNKMRNRKTRFLPLRNEPTNDMAALVAP